MQAEEVPWENMSRTPNSHWSLREGREHTRLPRMTKGARRRWEETDAPNT